MKTRKRIITHPANWGTIKQALQRQDNPLEGKDPRSVMFGTMNGIPVHTNQHMNRWVTRFVPPVEPYIEYEESDTVWLEYFGYGHREDTEEMLIQQIDEQMFNTFIRPEFKQPIYKQDWY